MTVKTTVRLVLDAPEEQSGFDLAAAIALALRDVEGVPRPYYMEVTRENTTTILNGQWLKN